MVLDRKDCNPQQYYRLDDLLAQGTFPVNREKWRCQQLCLHTRARCVGVLCIEDDSDKVERFSSNRLRLRSLEPIYVSVVTPKVHRVD